LAASGVRGRYSSEVLDDSPGCEAVKQHETTCSLRLIPRARFGSSGRGEAEANVGRVRRLGFGGRGFVMIG